MPSRPSLRAMPWLLLLQAGSVAGEHWRALSDKERARLLALYATPAAGRGT